MLLYRSTEDIVQRPKVIELHVVPVDEMLWLLPLRTNLPSLSICFWSFAVLIHVSIVSYMIAFCRFSFCWFEEVVDFGLPFF